MLMTASRGKATALAGGFRTLLVWTSVTTLVFWLPTVRGLFDGNSYEWGLFGFGGRGIRGDYWLPVVGTTFTLATLAVAWRGLAVTVSASVLAVWHVALAFAIGYAAVSNPDEFRFEGDTLGIDVSLTIIGPVLFGVPALASLYYLLLAARGEQPDSVAPAQTARRYVRLCLLALLPVQFVLFRNSVDGVSDQIGVLTTIVQWLLVGSALRR
jgi:hypothetical protein